MATTSRKRTTPKPALRSKPAKPQNSPNTPEKVELGTGGTASDAVDEQLARYREMRDFGVTAEPSGSSKEADAPSSRRASKKVGSLPFVIQKHAASHLHYDFRLGWNGVLKSWAVAKGPSYNTKDRRLAVQVEDHPMEYGGFEGIIPKGQYGGGTVMVWDQGTWSPQPGHEDVDAGLRDGSLKFEMFGSKMHGKWTLVRMNSAGQSSTGRWRNNGKPNWLLIKEHDEFERGPEDPCITDEAPNSAVTGRNLDQIASHEDHVWNSKETAGTGQAWFRKANSASSASEAKSVVKTTVNVKKTASAAPASSTAKTSKRVEAKEAESQPAWRSEVTNLTAELQPTFIKPQLALEVETPPAGEGWLHELKLDGYRIQARKSGKAVSLLTRSGLDWTHRVRSIADAIAALPVGDVTLDGEAVVVAEDGTTNFAKLQASFQEGASNPLTYFCFDLLHIEGHNPRELPLVDRKVILSQLLGNAGTEDAVRLSEHLDAGGEAIFHHACELHAEGIISKRADAPYRAGRGGDWLKAKCLHEQEFVIGGFTLSAEGPDRIGSLLLGYYRDGKLVYAGRTGTGFTQKTKRALREQLGKLERRSVPFDRPPAEARRDAVWVAPELVAQVRFATWTAENLVRQAAFLGLREDKAASEVRREEATVAPRPKGSSRSAEPTKAPGSTAASQLKPKSEVAKTPPTAISTRPSISTKVSTSPPVRLTHPNKVLDPETGLTKAKLAEYYWAVAERMLPHIADRPLSLVRCPEGAGKPCFYQKHVNHMLPPGVGGIDVPAKKTGIPEPYITLNTTQAIAGLAQMGVLEVHPWGSRNDDLEHPDRIIFDLDPDESLPWSAVCEAAAEVRQRLKRAGLESFLKTTGGKGLHVDVPILPELDWPQVKELAHAFVSRMERANPARYLTKMTKAARKGKIYLDYLRNERGATAVAPYSPRARAGVHVSMPLPWTDLKLTERPVFPVRHFSDWLPRQRSDPWKAMLTVRQRLNPEKIRAL